ncbi:MAG: glycosyltransferase family 2 protein [Patescibacteria group bacterium]|nr:glycosyltransferase family 2 protein [Patescibacteria group bacterium]
MRKCKVTIVIPCLNEEKVIGDVLIDCKLGLKKVDPKGQILIIDSGNDKSGKIAKSLGAEVIKVPRRGLGQAYLDAIPHIKGDYVIMGDADGTYDYKEIDKFVKKLDQGYEYVMGTRIKGWIEDAAMPKLHRYFGTPLTTLILDKLFNLNFSDIHCGMRAMTKEALLKIDLKSRSWEYASEMVVKSGLLKLKSTEVPIHFYKDKKGRMSHHKRAGWFSPWYAGWINLKIMLLYAPNFIFFIPGFCSLTLGILITIVSTFGLLNQFKYHFALLGFLLTTIGYLIIQLGVFSKIFSDLNKYYKDPITTFINKYLNYNRGVISGLLMSLIGIFFDSYLLIQWYVHNFKLASISIYGTSGLTLIILGFQTIFFTFIYELFKLSKDEK